MIMDIIILMLISSYGYGITHCLYFMAMDMVIVKVIVMLQVINTDLYLYSTIYLWL